MKHKVRLSKILRGIFHFRFRFVFYQCLYFCSTKYIDSLTLTIFRMVFLGTVHGGKKGSKRPSLPKICHTYPTMMKLCTVMPYLKKVQKLYHLTHPMSPANTSSFLLEISKFGCVKKHMYRLHFDTKFLILLTFLESLKIVLTKKVIILMMLAKMAIPGVPKITVFRNKGYGVII